MVMMLIIMIIIIITNILWQAGGIGRAEDPRHSELETQLLFFSGPCKPAHGQSLHRFDGETNRKDVLESNNLGPVQSTISALKRKDNLKTMC